VLQKKQIYSRELRSLEKKFYFWSNESRRKDYSKEDRKTATEQAAKIAKEISKSFPDQVEQILQQAKKGSLKKPRKRSSHHRQEKRFFLPEESE
jgi:hypothetical protein